MGLCLTESAASVPVVMHNPPHSYGEVVKDINDLPFFVAKYVVQEALKLFPEKAKENAKVLIESALDKFKSIR